VTYSLSLHAYGIQSSPVRRSSGGLSAPLKIPRSRWLGTHLWCREQRHSYGFCRQERRHIPSRLLTILEYNESAVRIGAGYHFGKDLNGSQALLVGPSGTVVEIVSLAAVFLLNMLICL
jgi:hypothetical protein